MLSEPDLARALAAIKPVSHAGNLARRVGLGGLLTPIAGGGRIDDLEFLFAGRRRNRFTPANGARSIYLGEDEDVGAAETKRTALLGSYAKKPADPAAIFWVEVYFPNAVLNLTDPAVLSALGATDAEIYDPNWKDHEPISPPEILGSMAFRDGRFAAIKYWSVRQRMAGKKGVCFCVFRTRVKAPCRLRVLSSGIGNGEEWT